jgi:hypothetical protein
MPAQLGEHLSEQKNKSRISSTLDKTNSMHFYFTTTKTSTLTTTLKEKKLHTVVSLTILYQIITYLSSVF